MNLGLFMKNQQVKSFKSEKWTNKIRLFVHDFCNQFAELKYIVLYLVSCTLILQLVLTAASAETGLGQLRGNLAHSIEIESWQSKNNEKARINTIANDKTGILIP